MRDPQMKRYKKDKAVRMNVNSVHHEESALLSLAIGRQICMEVEAKVTHFWHHLSWSCDPGAVKLPMLDNNLIKNKY